MNRVKRAARRRAIRMQINAVLCRIPKNATNKLAKAKESIREHWGGSANRKDSRFIVDIIDRFHPYRILSREQARRQRR